MRATMRSGTVIVSDRDGLDHPYITLKTAEITEFAAARRATGRRRTAASSRRQTMRPARVREDLIQRFEKLVMPFSNRGF